MDDLIFYVFLLVILLAYLIDGQRKTSRVRPNQQASNGFSWTSLLVGLPMFVAAAMLAQFIIGPWIDKHLSGANTAWVLSSVMFFAMLAAIMDVVERLERHSR
ncbi:hypothetical protein BH23CHL2_BH23CHL2_26570 [soil metagenome]